MLGKEKPDILALCETWIEHHEPKFCNYVCEWKHRIGQRGGGLGLVVRSGLQYTSLELRPFNGGVLECQAVSIYMTDDKTLCLLNLYNPNKDISLAEMSHYINQLGKSFLVLGDFNAHSLLLDFSCMAANQSGRMLEDLMLQGDACLVNPVDFYTYVSPSSGKRSCLDLRLTSSELGGWGGD